MTHHAPSMRDLIDTIETPDLPSLDEAGASRIALHIAQGRQFFMISAFRVYFDYATNLKRTDKMRRVLTRLHKLSYIEQQGEYTETIPDQEPRPAIETSFFVMPREPGRVNQQALDRIAHTLLADFEQEAVVIGDGERIYLWHPNGEEIDLGDTATFRPEVIATLGGSSLIGGKRYSFSSAETAAQDVSPEVKAVTKGVRYGSAR